MSLVNSATIIGHVGQDAEFKDFKDRTVVNFTMATNENRKDAEGKWTLLMELPALNRLWSHYA